MYVCMYVPVCRVVASYSETTHQCVNTYTRTVLVFTSVLSAEKLSLKVLNYDVISWFTPAKNLSRSSMLTCCLLMLLSHIVVNVSWLVIRPTWFLLHMAHLSPYYRVHTCQCHCLAVVGKSQIFVSVNRKWTWNVYCEKLFAHLVHRKKAVKSSNPIPHVENNTGIATMLEGGRTSSVHDHFGTLGGPLRYI